MLTCHSENIVTPTPPVEFKPCENCGLIFRTGMPVTGFLYVRSLAHLFFCGTVFLGFIFSSFLPCIVFLLPSFPPSLSYFLSLPSTTQTVLEPVPAFLPQPLECWGCRHEPPHRLVLFFCSFFLTLLSLFLWFVVLYPGTRVHPLILCLLSLRKSLVGSSFPFCRITLNLIYSPCIHIAIAHSVFHCVKVEHSKNFSVFFLLHASTYLCLVTRIMQTQFLYSLNFCIL